MESLLFSTGFALPDPRSPSRSRSRSRVNSPFATAVETGEVTRDGEGDDCHCPQCKALQLEQMEIKRREKALEEKVSHLEDALNEEKKISRRQRQILATLALKAPESTFLHVSLEEADLLNEATKSVTAEAGWRGRATLASSNLIEYALCQERDEQLLRKVVLAVEDGAEVTFSVLNHFANRGASSVSFFSACLETRSSIQFLRLPASLLSYICGLVMLQLLANRLQTHPQDTVDWTGLLEKAAECQKLSQVWPIVKDFPFFSDATPLKRITIEHSVTAADWKAIPEEDRECLKPKRVK